LRTSTVSARPARPSDTPFPLRRDELPSDTVELARFLIGTLLVHDVDGVRLSGRIVETEAYLVGDAASHAFRGETKRNRSMFLERGHAYVYISYGCWPMLNISAGEAGIGTAVLLRALEPVEDVEEMRRDRAETRPFDIARGPGRLAVAMRISLAHDGLDLCGNGPLRLHHAPCPPGRIRTATRIGITKDSERLLRFFEQGNPHVSGPRSLLGL
jgi:DNA-3-methyladenine glycosylase